MRTRRLLLIVVLAAIGGFAIFGLLVYRTVLVEEASPADALQRFEAVRSALGGRDPLLVLDESGRVVRRAVDLPVTPRPVTRLGVLAYQQEDERLATADVPMWFFKLKGPAAQYLVRGTGLDLERLEITAADLERYGPAVVIDHARANGDRLLVWTE